MKTENEIIKKAAQTLAGQTNLQIKYKTGKTADYRLEIAVPDDNRKAATKYIAEIKRTFSNAKLGDTMIQAKRASEPYLLVTEYITQPQAEKLRELGVSFLDTAGNAYLNAPGLFVFISGKKAAASAEKPISIFRPAGIKLLLAFLMKPGFENADYRTIARETGVTRTTVGRILNDLEKGGYLTKRGNQERFLTRKTELVKRWIFYYSEQFRPKLSPVKYHSTKYGGRWWEDVDINEYKAVWGGETGGAILTKHLKPQTATVYADSMLPKLQAIYGLVRDEKGEIEILKKFWTFGELGNVAPPLVVYADLLATADERNLETAQIIYDRYLAPLAEENS
ncbi:MAG: type IV toxin-antitoxin system AbiEi family antitoxin [Acidobacteriota bacterium]|nr:type IV toxin-antitoxin system AbiEi family antitoxin [Acidobacteriota bacterium]